MGYYKIKRLDSAEEIQYKRAFFVILIMGLIIFTIGMVLLNQASIRYDWNGLLQAKTIIAMIISPVLFFYIISRFDARMISILHIVVFIVLLSFVIGPLIYSITALSGSTPLADGRLAAMDKALGFDSAYLLQIANEHPTLTQLADWIYMSPNKQIIALAFCLTLRAEYEHLQQYMIATYIALICCAVGVFFMPAVGSYVHFGFTAEIHPAITLEVMTEEADIVSRLRSNSITVFEPHKIAGIVTFPSFHATLAVLLTWSAWRLPVLRWFFLILNTLMLAATPLHGSHYLCDLIAGIAVAGISIWSAIIIRMSCGLAMKLTRGATRLGLENPV